MENKDSKCLLNIRVVSILVYIYPMNKWLIIGSIIMFSSCSDTPRVDTAAVKQEMKARKIAYVTKGEMSIEAEEIGLDILAAYKSKQIDKDSLERLEGISLKSISEANLSEATALENQIFEAYNYSFQETGELPGNNIQYDKDLGVYYISSPDQIGDSSFVMWSVSVSDKAIIIRRGAQ